jgi:hypothetical protein
MTINWLVLTSGVITFMLFIGHITVGVKDYLAPMLDAGFNGQAKKIMHCQFHYVTVFVFLSSVVLTVAGLGIKTFFDLTATVLFVAVAFLAFTIAQFAIALKSTLDKPFLKLFQWIIFIMIAAFALFGIF